MVPNKKREGKSGKIRVVGQEVHIAMNKIKISLKDMFYNAENIAKILKVEIQNDLKKCESLCCVRETYFISAKPQLKKDVHTIQTDL